MTLKGKRRTFLLGGLALGLPLAGVGPALRPAAGQATARVRLGFGVPTIDPTLAALSSVPQKLFWPEEGLEVEVTGFAGSGTALQLLASGRLDVVFGGTNDVFVLRERGVALQAFASSHARTAIYPAVLEDSPIRSLADLRGKRVGTIDGSSVISYGMAMYLAAVGLTQADLGEVVPVGLGVPALEALRSGDVDVLQLWHGGYITLEQATGVRFRRLNDDPFFDSMTFTQGFLAMEPYIRQNRDVLVRLLRGASKAIVVARHNPEAAVSIHFDAYPGTVPLDVPREDAVGRMSLSLLGNDELWKEKSEAGIWGEVQAGDVERAGKALVEVGLTSELEDWTSYYQPGIVEEANDYDAAAVRDLAASL